MKEASFVEHQIEELFEIPFVYHQMATFTNQYSTGFAVEKKIRPEELKSLTASLELLDHNLKLKWDKLNNQVEKAYDLSYSSVVQQNINKIKIGVPNIVGTVFSILVLHSVMDYRSLPTLHAVPAVLSKSIQQLTRGQVTNDFFLGEKIAIFSQLLWGYGYTTPALGQIRDPNPGCGLKEVQRLKRKYSEFRDFTFTYGTAHQIYTGERHLTLNTLPVFAKYRMKRFVRELKSELFCLLNGPSTTLSFYIDSWLQLSLRRMDITAKLRGL